MKPRAARLLTDLGLWERRQETVGSYSRGMQQKVAIAAALITDPPVILLDEPTIGLDVEAARTVKDWIVHLARDEGKTVVLTTHQLAIAQELADRIAVIRAGAVIADLLTGELLSRYADDRFEVRAAKIQNGFPGTLPPATRIEQEQNTTRLLLPDADQAVLHDVLDGLRANGVPLISVSQAPAGPGGGLSAADPPRRRRRSRRGPGHARRAQHQDLCRGPGERIWPSSSAPARRTGPRRRSAAWATRASPPVPPPAHRRSHGGAR